MKIAICSDYYYPKLGGISSHIDDLARSLENRGHEVTIFTKKAKTVEVTPKFKVIRLDTRFGTSKTLDLPDMAALKRAISKEKPDIIHSHHAFSPMALLSLVAGKKLGIKTVLTTHSIQALYDSEYLWKPSSYTFLSPYRKYISNADSLIAVSYAAAEFIKHFSNKKVTIIPNGIRMEQFMPGKKTYDKKSILFVGRLVYRKGAQLLVKSMKQVVRQNANARLTIVGSGYLAPPLRFMINSYSMKDNITIKENLDNSLVIKEYQKANVFAMPSLYGESFGIVLLEAMASKTPIVATNQGGIKEIITHKKTGLLVKQDRVRDLSRNILTLLDQPPLSKKLSQNAFKEVKKYDWNNVVRKIEDVYEH